MSVLTKVRIEEFISWFEFQLAKCLALELRQINDTLSFIFGMITFIKTNSNKLIANSSSNTSQQSKKLKGDYVDSIISQFGTSPPILPHSEFLDEFLQKTRKKLKSNEDDGGPIFSRTDLQNRDTTVSLRSVINSILHELDILESLKIKQSLSCSYLSEIKSQVHSPLSSLLTRYSQLPSIKDAVELNSSSQQVVITENAYNTIRSFSLFQHISIQKQEAEYIESEVYEMLKPLRQAAKTITKLSNVRRESAWSRILLPLLACSTGELMARCCHQTVMEGFASSVLELQTVLRNPPPANAPPSLNRRVQLFAEIVDDVLVGIEMFDIELFSAHLEDWKLRVYEIEIKSSSPEFDRKYKELIKVRSNYKKAVESYEKKIQQQNEIISIHEKMRTEMYHMKNKLQEICFSELKEEVDIILPF